MVSENYSVIGGECWIVCLQYDKVIVVVPTTADCDRSVAIDNMLDLLDSGKANGDFNWHNPNASRPAQWRAAKSHGYKLMRFKLVPA